MDVGGITAFKQAEVMYSASTAVLKNVMDLKKDISAQLLEGLNEAMPVMPGSPGQKVDITV